VGRFRYGHARADRPRATDRKGAPRFLAPHGRLDLPFGAARDFNPKFFNIYRTTLARAPFYGSLGNHDIRSRNGAPYLQNFVLPTNGPLGLAPERNYSFDYADAHIAVLDTNASTTQMRNILVPWLRQDMERSQARWKFVVFHHPPYSSGLHGDDARTQRVLDPVLRQLKVDLVFNGHDHHYERWKPRGGVVYIVTGAGGAVLYPRKRTDPATAVFSGRKFSFTRIDIAKDTLRGRPDRHRRQRYRRMENDQSHEHLEQAIRHAVPIAGLTSITTALTAASAAGVRTATPWHRSTPSATSCGAKRPRSRSTRPPNTRAIGLALNTSAMFGWALIFAKLFSGKSSNRAVSSLGGGVFVALLAYVVDYHVVPKRLTPGR
jgi:hypothetical protein